MNRAQKLQLGLDILGPDFAATLCTVCSGHGECSQT
jgi:hypothetical protein